MSRLFLMAALLVLGACGPKPELATGDAGIKSGTTPSESQKDAMRRAHLPQGQSVRR